MAGTKVKHRSGAADGATAIGYEFDTQASFTTNGARIASFKNAASEKLAVDKDGNILSSGANSTWVVRPSEGGAGISAAISAANSAGGGIIQLLAGTYAITSTMALSDLNNIIIQGMGEDTILDSSAVGGGIVWQLSGTRPSNTRPCTNVTKGDTSVFTTTVGDASAYQVGDRVLLDIRTTDGAIRFERNIVKTAGNGVTGEIQLESPILYSANLTTTVSGFRNGNNIILRGFKVQQNTSSTSRFLDFNYGHRCLVERIWFDNKAGFFTQTALSVNSHFDTTVRECKSEFFPSDGFYFDSVMDCNALNNISRFNGVGIHLNVGEGALLHGNQCKDNTNRAIDVAAYTNNVRINDNHCTNTGIRVNGLCFNSVIASNIINCDTAGVGIKCDGTGASITGNVVQYGVHGIDSQGGRSDLSIVGNTLLDCGNAGGSAINVSAMTDATIANNIIKRSGSSPNSAISANTTSTRVSITGNVIDTYSSNGIRIESTTTGCVVSGNTVSGCTGDEISVDNGSSNNLIIGNNCTGGTISEGTGSNLFTGNLV